MELYIEKKECCGCGACLNACPKKAIKMTEDEYGYLYPEIDKSLCIDCGMCKKVCAFQFVQEKNEPVKAYAGVTKDEEILKNSASGGIFTTLAKVIIENNGVVYGAAICENWNVKHIKVDSLVHLNKLQGSKYTQSSTGTSFKEVKELLKEGKTVLYSGTPCQIAGLYGYLGNRPDNLYTVDLICHGVPNNKMFRDFITSLEQKYNKEIVKFVFRDKELGWGKNGSAIVRTNDNRIKKIKLWESQNSFFFYFKNGWLCRENCYECKYTCKNRPADLTVGDFWGIEKNHPNYLGKDGFDETKGLSAIICNTDKGDELIELAKKYLKTKPSSFEKIAAGNPQLCKPTKKGKRDDIVALYKLHGWKSVDDRYRKSIGIRRWSSQIKALIPSGIKAKLKARG